MSNAGVENFHGVPATLKFFLSTCLNKVCNAAFRQPESLIICNFPLLSTLANRCIWFHFSKDCKF